MTFNKNEIKKFFEEVWEIRNLAIDVKKKILNEEKENLSYLKPRYIGVFLSNYYAENINKKFHKDLLK